MSSLLKIALVMSLVDRVSAPLQKVDDALRRNGQGAKGLADRFGGLARQMEAVRHAGRGLAVAGLAAGGLLGLGSVPAEAARAEHALRSLGNVGGLTDRQLSEMGRELLATTKATNQTLAELIQGTNTLVAAGLDPRIATRFMPVIGKAATATQATVDDLSRTLFSVYDNLKVPESALMQAIDTLTASGKEGRFELANMARYFPMLTAGARSLGMEGVPAVAQLGAALQIAMKGAGTPEEAATNLQNFIQKITSKETVKNFEKFGVNVEQEMKRAAEKGLDPIEHMLNVIMQVTGGNKFKLAEIFGDMQVTNFLVPMMKNLAEYRSIRDKTMTASGVVDKDFQAMMGTTIEQWKALKITMAQIMMPNLAGPLSVVNGVLKALTGHAVLAKATFYGIATAVGAGGLLMTLGAMGSVLPKVAAGWAMLGRAKAFFMATERVGMFNEIIRTASPASQMLARMTAALRGTAIAQWALNSAFLANPVTWVVAAIAAGAVLIYRYWGPISGFFKRLWTALATINWKEAGLNIILPNLAGPLSVVNGVLKALTGHAVLAKATFYGIAAAVGAGGLLMTLGAMGSVLPKVAAGWAMLGRAKAFFMATERVGMFNEIIRTASPASVWLGRMATALRGTAIAQWALNSAFLANPVTWVVAAIAAGAVLIYRYWGPISGFFKRLWTALATINWKEAGLNIVRSIWQGITSLATKPVEALKSIAQKMRNLLPFSPAKDGPLRDLHRIRLVETIAQAIRPAPMVQAMRGAVGAAAGVLSGGRMAGAGGGTVHVTYSPTINVNGASTSVKEDLMGVLRQHKDELLRLVEGAMQKRDRVRYA